MRCPLCDSVLEKKMNECFFRCETCFSLVKDKKYYMSPEKEKARYETHNNDVNDPRYQKFTSPITNYVLDHFTPADQGLDFGSGTGPVISKMLQDKQYNITQYDPFFNPNPEAFNKQYDYIVSCEVFEHFHHPRKEIETIAQLLKPKGKLLILTLLYHDGIEFNKWGYINDATHVFIYQKETFEYIAKQMPFEIELLSERMVILRKTDII